MISKLQIGPYTYSIEWVDGDFVGSDAVGYCRVDCQQIAIATKFKRQRVLVALLDEILYALWDTCALDEGCEHEEQVVHTLASGLAQVLIGNPELVQFVKEAVRFPESLTPITTGVDAL